MVNSYDEWKNAKQLPKLKKLIKDKDISRSMMVLFLKKNGEKVLTKESTDDIIKRINNAYGFDYVKDMLPKIKVKIGGPKPVAKKYGCKIIFYRLISETDDTVYKKTIKHDGKRYRAAWPKLATVKGDIMPYNNKRTIRPTLNMEPAELKTTTLLWNTLLKILMTDEEIKEFLDLADDHSFDYDIIIVKDVVEIVDGKIYDPLEGRLFSEQAPKAIYNKNISYELNTQAATFAEMFSITLNKYTIDNYKLNSCLINMFVDTWYESFNRRKKDGKRMYAELTYESVCQIIGLTYKSQDIGASLRESVKFLEKFRLGIDVVNVYGDMLFSYRPKGGLNTSIYPSVLRALIHNNHIYKLDKDCKNKLHKLIQTYNEKEDKPTEEDFKLQVSDKYKLRNPVLEDCEVHFIETLDDCVDKVINAKTENVRFVTNNDLEDILFQMINNDYTPHVSFSALNIISLSLKVGKVYATIENADTTAPEDTMIQLESKEKYLEYHKANDEFYFSILQDHLKSNYNDTVLEIENKYPMGPIAGYLTDKYHENQIYNAIDINKAYTDCLMKICNVPVFGYFDEYKPYDNHPIENYTMYLVEVHIKDDVVKKPVPLKVRKQKVIAKKEFKDERLSIEKFISADDLAMLQEKKTRKIKSIVPDQIIDDHDIDDEENEDSKVHISSIAQSILFPSVFHRCFGFKLLRCSDIQYKIHSFRRPCEVEEVNFNEPIQKLWSNDKLSSQNKKDIVNRTTGLCEKKYNTASVCKMFDSYAEAQFYQIKYKGKIHSLQQSFKSVHTIDQNEDPLNFGLDMGAFKDEKIATKLEFGKSIHLLVTEEKKMLVEGYRYIKELIYDIMSLKMYELYNEVVSKGVVPKGIKTDAILVSKSKSELEKLFNFSFRNRRYQVRKWKEMPR